MKPTHTDQYLHWDSNHHITAKQSVFNTLAHRAKVVSSSQDKLDRELQHIKTALQQCQFPNWALNQWHHKCINPTQPNNSNNTNNNNQQDNNPNKRNITIVVPYMPGTGETFKKLCRSKGIQVHFKGTNTLRILLGNSKEKDSPKQPNRHDLPLQVPPNKLYQCLHRRIRQITGRKGQGTPQGPLPIHLHSTTTGHPMDPEQFSIVHKEVNNHSRTIKEAMFICVQYPTLNRNLGKYQLLHIWDHLLLASPTLQCKPSSLPTPPHPT